MLIALAAARIAVHAKAETGVTDSTIPIGRTIGLTGTVAAPAREMNEGDRTIELISKRAVADRDMRLTCPGAKHCGYRGARSGRPG